MSISATDRAYEALKIEILHNRLSPGAPISIDDYVSSLAISRTPVREAILRLEREGLIEIRPRQGTFVAPLDLHQIRELYAVRRLLEGEAARLATPHIPAEDLSNLQRHLKKIEDPAERFEAGQEVHLLCAQHCGNRTLRRMLEAMQDHFIRFRALSRRLPVDILNFDRQHQAILKALILRDAKKAEACAQAHMEYAAAVLLENIINRHETGPRVTLRLPEVP